MSKKFYITAAIPYVNAKPHIGHALEFVQTDTIARYHKLLGEEVKSLSGGDENALKNVQAAEKANEPIQDFVNKNTQAFLNLTKNLNCNFDIWQKGSDQHHHFPSSQKLWELCKKDIYQKTYTGLYCVGCEAFYTKDELNENGECFEHPGKPLEEVSETNYFFKLSRYQKKLEKIISDEKIKIYPAHRKNEVLEFIKTGLQDISISRSNERAKNWGVPVPGDDTQRMYVWFDALNIYQSGIGFGWDEQQYKKYWPADMHVIGKGIIRFHAVYWPAFLLSAELELPKAIFVHDYFTVNGQKMSKTLGNVIDPLELIEKYGADPLRYYFLAKFNPFSDGDFSESKFREVYNADLANGLGNLVARVARLAENSGFIFTEAEKFDAKTLYFDEIVSEFSQFRFDLVLASIWRLIASADKHVNQYKPWLKDQHNINLQQILQEEIDYIRKVALQIKPFLPETSERILEQFKGSRIKSGEPLFPRLK